MKKHLYLLPLCSLLCFTACNDSSQPKPTVITTTQSLPAWYTHSSNQDGSYIYGLGLSTNRKDALNSALSDVVSTLSVSVSSNYSQQRSSQTQDGAESYSVDIQERVNVITKEIKLTDYEVLHQEQLGDGRFVVQVRVSKQRLYKSMHERLENTFKMLDASLSGKTDTLEKIMIYRKYLTLLKHRMDNLAILHTLNPAFDDSAFKASYEKRIKAYNELIANKTFKLSVNDPYGAYAPYIYEGLVQDGLVLTTGDSYDYYVRVNIKEEHEVAVRRHVITFLTTTFNVSVGDSHSNKALFFTTFSLNSESDESIEKARALVVEALIDKTERHGVFNIPKK